MKALVFALCLAVPISASAIPATPNDLEARGLVEIRHLNSMLELRGTPDKQLCGSSIATLLVRHARLILLKIRIWGQQVEAERVQSAPPLYHPKAAASSRSMAEGNFYSVSITSLTAGARL